METAEKRHYALIERYNRKMTVTHKGQVVAETDKALILKEVGKSLYNPVFYIPQEDIKVELEMDPVSRGACPIKGASNRWHLKENPTSAYFGWSYEDPLPKSKKLKGHMAFNAAYVTFISAPLQEHD